MIRKHPLVHPWTLSYSPTHPPIHPSVLPSIHFSNLLVCLPIHVTFHLFSHPVCSPCSHFSPPTNPSFHLPAQSFILLSVPPARNSSPVQPNWPLSHSPLPLSSSPVLPLPICLLAHFPTILPSGFSSNHLSLCVSPFAYLTIQCPVHLSIFFLFFLHTCFPLTHLAIHPSIRHPSTHPQVSLCICSSVHSSLFHLSIQTCQLINSERRST